MAARYVNPENVAAQGQSFYTGLHPVQYESGTGGGSNVMGAGSGGQAGVTADRSGADAGRAWNYPPIHIAVKRDDYRGRSDDDGEGGGLEGGGQFMKDAASMAKDVGAVLGRAGKQAAKAGFGAAKRGWQNRRNQQGGTQSSAPYVDPNEDPLGPDIQSDEGAAGSGNAGPLPNQAWDGMWEDTIRNRSSSRTASRSRA